MNVVCTCDGRATLVAVLNGEEPPLCEVHDADAIAEREQAEREAQADEIDAHYQRVLDGIRQRFEPDPEPEPDVRELIHTAFTSGSTPLGGAGIDQILAAHGFTNNDHGDHT